MDVVSDAISALRVGRPLSSRVRARGTWCRSLAPYGGAGFHVVLEGSCWLLPENGPGITLGPGDVVLLPHGSAHVLADSPMDRSSAEHAQFFEPWTDAREELRFIEDAGDPPAHPAGGAELLCGKYRLDRARAHPLMAELPDIVHVPSRVGHHRDIRSAIELLGRESDASRPGAGIALPGLLDLLLVYLVRAWLAENQEGRTEGWSIALSDPVVAPALRALHDDPARAWSAVSLSAEVGVSRATLTRRFTGLLGRPPMAYLTWWRMTRAAALLREPGMSLDRVAAKVGYGSPFAFSHAFKRTFGDSPGRYRAESGARSDAADG
ncbi:AraC family transcriptional regulator [Streptomyces sp. NBC_00344]|uniref:AraC family transcriptional regulator n=1 Tax=Streptomyces sp. NBC_00344 TaxID=2975720 RepID=UPI002E1E0945